MQVLLGLFPKKIEKNGSMKINFSYLCILFINMRFYFILFCFFTSFVLQAKSYQTKKKLLQNLESLRTYVNNIPDYEDRKRAKRLIDESIDLLDDEGGIHPVRPTASIMDEFSFSQLLKQLKNEAFDSNKYRILESTFTKGQLNCSQLRVILECFQFDEDRIKTVKILYKKLVDPINIHQIFDVFTFSSSKDKVLKMINDQ